MKISKQERRILKQLDKEGYFCIARDENGLLCAYTDDRLIRDDDAWTTFSDFKEIDSDLFKFVKWQDNEPFQIELLLENLY